jgi:large subunit ribosomal protein L20
MRIKRGVAAHKRHKKIFKANKGYRGPCKNVFKRAMEAWLKAGQHAYKGRKLKKRTFRRLWIVRIGNALKDFGINYSRFINAQLKSGVKINRKVLSEMAVNYPASFGVLVNEIKKSS